MLLLLIFLELSLDSPEFLNLRKKIMVKRFLSYRASHIILDYLQSLTPKYAHYTKKNLAFSAKKNFY